MRTRTFYHGSTMKFDEIDLSKAKEGKDFGKGFYVTTNKEQAISWANRNPNKKGYLYEYTISDNIELENIQDYRVKVLNFYNREWADYVSLCRYEFYESGDDIVYDRMADSKYQVLANAIEDYYFNRISLLEFISYTRFANVKYDQYCFKTQRAVNLLSLVERKSL